ncbi:hypothetical protein [Croceicoccus marinus]|uniref:Lipoprotein n=1 Tax=Croceicoccus marinus TaxID=450378 RepID=A0A1Z1FA74_9SPHN|nr:hypothetical protein [Croceicoccus marinus]ARU15597.1 hypothetical protein A9D14_04625 [Croceicoccus marinus]
MERGAFPRVMRGIVAACGALALSACFLTPGKFESELLLTSGGVFAFSYEGEITTMGLNQLAQMGATQPFEASCADDGMEPRDCTAEEVEQQRAEWEAEQGEDAREREQFIKMFGGMDPSDPEIAEKLVATLRKMRGWEAVSYRGEGIYDVRYRTEGVLTHSFLFPVLEDMPGMTHFVSVTPRSDGSIRVQAPGFGGEQAGMGQGLPMMMAMGAMQDGDKDAAQIVLPDGQFTIRTDGQILTNNTDEGPVVEGDMKVLRWTVDESSKTAPTALIAL